MEVRLVATAGIELHFGGDDARGEASDEIGL
jgi:hypothetical protein